jgi:hypothetical protein
LHPLPLQNFFVVVVVVGKRAIFANWVVLWIRLKAKTVKSYRNESKEKERMNANLYSVEVNACTASPQIASILAFLFLVPMAFVTRVENL